MNTNVQGFKTNPKNTRCDIEEIMKEEKIQKRIRETMRDVQTLHEDYQSSKLG